MKANITVLKQSHMFTEINKDWNLQHITGYSINDKVQSTPMVTKYTTRVSLSALLTHQQWCWLTHLFYWRFSIRSESGLPSESAPCPSLHMAPVAIMITSKLSCIICAKINHNFCQSYISSYTGVFDTRVSRDAGLTQGSHWILKPIHHQHIIILQ